MHNELALLLDQGGVLLGLGKDEHGLNFVLYRVRYSV